MSPDIIAFANKLADASGEIIRPYFRQRIAVANKPMTSNGVAVFDPVTEADKGAERAMRAIIERERPDDGILGEEYGEKIGTNGLRWVLDPVDGTRSFINGRHEWGSLIALEQDLRPKLGVIDQPCIGERFVAANGQAQLQSRGLVEPLKVRACEKLSDAILCATHPDAFYGEGEWAGFRRVQKQARLTRWGGDCYIFALMALGFCDIIVETTFKRWDIAALIPIVEAAGGVITNWQGGSCAAGGQILAAGDKRVHQMAIDLLNP